MKVLISGIDNYLQERQKEAETFIHPYYDHGIKDLPFFIITIHSNPHTHRMSWKFDINEAVIKNKELVQKINNQVGVIKLYRRLYRETNELLSDMLSGIDTITEQTLSFILQKEYKTHVHRRGTNDWHTVFVKALIDSPNFSVAEAEVYSKRIKPVNKGINA